MARGVPDTASLSLSIMQKERPSERLEASVAKAMGGRVHGRKVLSTVYNMAFEMMQDRGMRIEGECASEDQLMRRVDAGEPVLRAVGGKEGEETLVVMDSDDRTGVKFVRSLRESNPDSALCVVSVEGATPFTKKEMAGCDHIEFWQVNEMLFNPTRHALVPRHEEVPEGEVEALQEERCVRPDQWPSILVTDIIVRWYRFRKGTLVRIRRTGVGHEAGDYFRKVE